MDSRMVGMISGKLVKHHGFTNGGHDFWKIGQASWIHERWARFQENWSNIMDSRTVRMISGKLVKHHGFTNGGHDFRKIGQASWIHERWT